MPPTQNWKIIIQIILLLKKTIFCEKYKFPRNNLYFQNNMLDFMDNIYYRLLLIFSMTNISILIIMLVFFSFFFLRLNLELLNP